MPNATPYLQLVLPLYGEFQDSWDQIVNQNFETVDDHLADLQKALVSGTSTAPATAAFAGLVGAQSSLANRLNVSINPDGSLNLSNSPAMAALGSSATNGDDYVGSGKPNNSPRLRFDFSDLELLGARSPLNAARFNPAAPGRGLLDDGLAVRTRDNGAFDAAHPISSPDRPFVSGLVQGPDTFLLGVGPSQVRFDATLGAPGSWPVFNIDGYVFRIRQPLILDVSTDAGGATVNPGDVIYLFVSRADFGDPNTRTKLGTDVAPPQARDLRRLQSGADGVISGKTFSAASASFGGSASTWTVLPGDLLVIDGGTAAGSYVIRGVDSANSLTIAGTFKADGIGNVAWHIEDDAHPSVGCQKVADAATDPPFVPGRVYVGRAQLTAGGVQPVGGAPMSKIAFPTSGVFDSGWQNVNLGSFPLLFEHNLGMLPSHIEVFVRDAPGGEAFVPTRLQQLLVDFDTSNPTVEPSDPKRAWLRLPSMHWHSNRQRTQVQLSSGAPSALPVLFTKEDDATNVTAGQIRLLARR